MAHSPKPYYKPKRRTWYVEVARVQHALGRHPDGLSEPKKGRNGWDPPESIREAFHKKMTELADAARAKPAPVALADPLAHPFVSVLLDDFLGWLRKRVEEGSKEPRTLWWYEKYLGSFLDYLSSLEPGRPKVPSMTVENLLPEHALAWVDSQPGWKASRRSALVAVQRALNWAAKAGKLRSLHNNSPLARMEKPAQGRRELVVTQAEFDEALVAVDDPAFRDLLVLAWETGARPSELFSAAASFLDKANARLVYPLRLSKGRRVQRVVYLTEAALEVVARRAALFPAGPLLRTAAGRPWDRGTARCRFQNLRVTLGRRRAAEEGLLPPKIPRLKPGSGDDVFRAEHEKKVRDRRKKITEIARKHGPQYNLYALRHSYVTEALVRGVDAVTVSVLVGHRDTTMISRHYAHLAVRPDHLGAAARRARA